MVVSDRERASAAQALGPEPISAGFDAAYLFASTRARRTAIKLALMDNRVVVGVGNIYANEALFRAGIRPTRAANRISRARLARLVVAVRETLAAAIAKGGSTLRDYVDSDGARQLPARATSCTVVKGKPAASAPQPIRALRQAGRATS